MSYRTSVDLEDNSLVSVGASQTTKQRRYYYAQERTNFITLIGRTITFRRLRLFKFYMAFVLLVTLLVLVFKPHHTTKDELPELPSKSDYPAQLLNDKSQAKYDSKFMTHRTNSKLSHDVLDDAKVKTSSKEYGLLRDAKLDSVANKYLANVTYLLSMQEFAQMKNINVMQVRIKEAAKHSWDNYRRYAWGFDMLKPRSKEPDHWFDLGLTIVDAADTLIMMGLENEAVLALDWMENELQFNSRNENSNCFELTIRILAGILSAYHLTGRERLKSRAIDFGNILLHCYDTESGIIPYSDIDLATQKAHPPPWNPHSSLSEVATLQIEFRYLSQISGNPIYEQTTFQTSEHIHNLTVNRNHKLLPMYINPSSGQLEDSVITLGARSDSYYEYLLKQYLQTGIKWLESDYLDCMDEVRDKLFKHTNGSENYTYVAEMQVFKTMNDTEDIRYYNKMDHLVCFLPGTLALGFYHFSPRASEYRLKYHLETSSEKLNSRYDHHLDMAQALARTCYHMYSNMGTGLSPEIASFIRSATDDPLVQNQPELQVQSGSAHNILRPEFVESLFYLYHITGLPVYRDQAAEIFEAFQKYSRIPSGYSAISDVRNKPPPEADLNETLYRHAPDRMESFWLSETLKYLYLTFCDDRYIVGTLLNNYIFNTEAHPVPII